ncbi:hypothetical protein MLD38_032506 [Melastoma candidum]|uniref:Uncharacterized protein n=1 Tax=Melastoma candidum TaxID=119954 RepID=A0ACB9M4E6_9MYRT|nr:hypothetical protein MLD38_032506 [Melastoma candidum]
MIRPPKLCFLGSLAEPLLCILDAASRSRAVVLAGTRRETAALWRGDLGGDAVDGNSNKGEFAGLWEGTNLSLLREKS